SLPLPSTGGALSQAGVSGLPWYLPFLKSATCSRSAQAASPNKAIKSKTRITTCPAPVAARAAAHRACQDRRPCPSPTLRSPCRDALRDRDRCRRSRRRRRRAAHAGHRDRFLGAHYAVIDGHHAAAVDAPRHFVLLLARGDAAVALDAALGVAQEFHSCHGGLLMLLRPDKASSWFPASASPGHSRRSSRY